MSVGFTGSAGDILNDVGVEIGLDPSTDPFASSDATYRQMTYLINVAGRELCLMHPWQVLTYTDYIATDEPASIEGNTAKYDLPTDFLHYHSGSGWNSSDSRPMRGPITEQTWAYLSYGDALTPALDLSFHIRNDKLLITPDPSAVQQDLFLVYQSNLWVNSAILPQIRSTKCAESADVPFLDALLLGRYLKVKILEAKGFDSSKAQADFNQCFQLRVSKDRGAPTLSAARRRGLGLNGLNAPDSGYGS